jgi:ferritin
MLNKKMEKAINDQINAELFSSYLYLSMSAWFQRNSLPGFANWMQIQAQEEAAHAMIFFNYVHERGGKVTLAKIDQPDTEWKNVIDVFQAILKHEQKVTGLINKLVDLAMQERDHASLNMLQWFVSEQVEEEASVSEILDQLKMIEGKGQGLFMLDREMKGRVFINPITSKE